MKITLQNYILDTEEIEKTVRFSWCRGRKFSCEDKKSEEARSVSFRRLLKSAKETENLSPRELVQVIHTFEKIQNAGYEPEGPFSKSGLITRIFTRIKHFLFSGSHQNRLEALKKKNQDLLKEHVLPSEDTEVYKHIADSYFFGSGIHNDLNLAFAYYKKAALLNDSEAQYQLGTCYEKGLGVAKDFGEAFLCYQTAAIHDPRAQYKLGTCYEKGKGAEKSQEKADECYQLASELGSKEANYKLGLYKRAADLGHAKAQYKIACEIEEKTPFSEEVFKYLTQAARQNHSEAAFLLGKSYYNAPPEQRDYKKSWEYCTLAANLGDRNAQDWVGRFFLREIGDIFMQKIVSFSPPQGIAYLEKAAAQGHIESQKALSKFYAEGKHVAKDLTVAETWRQKYIFSLGHSQ